MQSIIIKELSELNLKISDFTDTISGRMTFEWRPPGRRPMSELFTKFSEVNIINIDGNWDISCLMQYIDQPGKSPLGISLNNVDGNIVFDKESYIYNFNSNDPRVKVVNAYATGQLLIRFLQPISRTGDVHSFIAPGSFIFVKQ